MSLPAAFRAFAATTARRAPLYSRLSAGVARSPVLPGLFADAPEPARVPVNLFAAVHFLLLADPGQPLARFYPNLAAAPDETDPVPAFLDFCAANAAELRRLLATRLPQTNEVGRAALLLAGLGRLGGRRLGLLDIGASAGLNLLLDRMAFADGRGNRLGESSVVVECAVRGARPGARGPHGLAEALPLLDDRLGLDANPVDLTDPDQARWLEACVWPDQADRFRRLRAAVELFGSRPAPVVAGDAVADLGRCLGRLAGTEPAVMTSWALCYLEPERQLAFVAGLERAGSERDLAWIWVEAPNRVGVLPVPQQLAGDDATWLGITTWRDGSRSDQLLARCHHHGYWLDWAAVPSGRG